MIKLHWSTVPGKFLDKRTGEDINLSSLLIPPGSKGPLFQGSAREWNETLIETISDVTVQLPDIGRIEASYHVIALLEQSLCFHEVLRENVNDDDDDAQRLCGFIDVWVGNDQSRMRLNIYRRDKLLDLIEVHDSMGTCVGTVRVNDISIEQ